MIENIWGFIKWWYYFGLEGVTFLGNEGTLDNSDVLSIYNLFPKTVLLILAIALALAITVIVLGMVFSMIEWVSKGFKKKTT